MKIIQDKLLELPAHAISRADVRTILSRVPAAWSDEIKTVRLSGSMKHVRFTSYNRFDQTLTIKSRGCTKEQALREILIALAAHALGIEFLGGHTLQERHAIRLRQVVDPLVEQLLPELSRKIVSFPTDAA
jgi:hypothetical protein